MFRIMCKSKIHHATVTGTHVEYNGSIGVDKKILEASNIYANEMVLIANLNNAARFETYVIPEDAGSGKIELYGGAAKLGSIGDTLIIISSFLIEEKEASNFKTKIIKLDKHNKIVK